MYARLTLVLFLAIIIEYQAMLINNNCNACSTQCFNGKCHQTCAGNCPPNCQYCSISCFNGICKENCGSCGSIPSSNTTVDFDWTTFNRQMQIFQNRMINWQSTFMNGMVRFQKNLGSSLSRMMTSIFG